MKILSCYITGFGRFRNQTFDFTQNPTAVKSDNGWGKTTLANFLVAMLYGLEASRSRAISDNLRQKYEPWQGGGFGGSLTFEVRGEKYRIERTFGKTPSGDTAKIYDKNNMLFYGFGERAETLGQALFGVDVESFKKTAYIPQGETDSDVPDGLKGRLIALLSAGNEPLTCGGAIARLDEAERALRAKRKPAKGKLDEIDEQIEYFSRARTEYRIAREHADELRRQANVLTEEMGAVRTRLNGVSTEMERCLKQDGNATLQRELEITLSSAKNELSALRPFFGEIDPAQVETEEIAKDVARFYEKTEGAGTRSRTKKRTKRLFSLVAFLLGIGLAAVGVLFITEQPFLGLLGLFFGGAAAVTALFPSIWSGRKKQKKDKREHDAKNELQTEGQTEALERKLARYFDAFAFEEIYDYRAALNTLREKRARYLERLETVKRCEEKLSLLVRATDGGNSVGAENGNVQNYDVNDVQNYGGNLQNYGSQTYAAERDMRALTMEKTSLERMTAELAERRGRLLAQEAEKRALAEKEAEAAGEESRLLEEKARLEKRLKAIRGAREILMRARETLASRYLEPVERNCKKYAEFLEGNGKKSSLIFSADGKKLFEEQGAYKDADYYSAGIRGLYGLCTRIALAEAVFKGELPPLVFDDPLTELDDKKTERAKLLIKELAKKYQIIYFTCKEERKL